MRLIASHGEIFDACHRALFALDLLFTELDQAQREAIGEHMQRVEDELEQIAAWNEGQLWAPPADAPGARRGQPLT